MVACRARTMYGHKLIIKAHVDLDLSHISHAVIYHSIYSALKLILSCIHIHTCAGCDTDVQFPSCYSGIASCPHRVNHVRIVCQLLTLAPVSVV